MIAALIAVAVVALLWIAAASTPVRREQRRGDCDDASPMIWSGDGGSGGDAGCDGGGGCD